MKRMLIAAALFASMAASAQSPKLAIGQKIPYVSAMKMVNTISFGGADIDNTVDATTYTNFTVKSIDGSKVTLTAITTRMVGAVNAMGQEMKYDTDDKSKTANPMVAEQLKELNKPTDIVIENGKTVGKKGLSGTTDEPLAQVANKLFLTIKDADVKEGFKWTENVTSEDGSNETSIYAITKVSPSEIEVTSNANIKVAGSMKQMGMDIQRNLNGSNTSVSVYDATTKILKATAAKATLTGNMQAMGNDIPATIKTTLTITQP